MEIGWSSAGTAYITRLVEQATTGSSSADTFSSAGNSNTADSGNSTTQSSSTGGGAGGSTGTNQPPPAQTGGQTATAMDQKPTYPTNSQGNYSDPSHPPNNDASAKWFWSNTAHQWVSGNYSYDANGQPLTGQKLTDAKAYDQKRAQDKLASWRPSANAATPAPAESVDAPVYDADTQTYSYKDKDGKWTYGVGVNDIYSKLNDTTKKEYPEWYFGQYAKTQDAGHRSALDSKAFDNQTFATRGGQTTKYAATNF